MKLLGIDPGKTTGWAILNLDEESRKLTPGVFGESTDESALEIQRLIQECDLVVIESFLLRPTYARKGKFDYDDMVAPRVIGAVQTLCKMNDTEYKMQPASVKPVGYGFAGLTYKKGKSGKGVHQLDALVHAVYYAVKHLNALPVGTKRS